MENFDIVTLTVNPALDKSTTFKGLIAEQKIRCSAPNYDAGGGGINVSKAIKRLGGKSLCIITSGGSAGRKLEKLIADEGIETAVVPIENSTRENMIALEVNSNAQYRVGFPGEPLSKHEMEDILESVRKRQPKFLVASGSICEGMTPDFYQKVASIAKENGSKLVVDTSGEPLERILEVGAYLIKPNIGELARLTRSERLDSDEAEEAARKIISGGKVEIVVVSLGPQGAILVSKDEAHHIPAPHVKKRSTVGAGDSMVGAMVWALSQDLPLKQVIQWGVACGSAATMNNGTQLFDANDAKRLFDGLRKWW
ncbi:1-phosphofructokinase family hexose kinase [Flavobacterium sp.]|uniref:1-phosphofructokinase family hexose kinase n=1 Tax=Flavobacterium sp. TaxID=239 RepID=UPI0012046398|nr:1-phosphofructokinase family hexose kinase [Flavobacterium sp.]RZJ72500.1 MAG: 1-phosphofructokinase family hexose kinase [Flavobacterium sp.]